MRYVLALFVLAAATWFAWSGYTDPLILGFGLFSCLLVTFLSCRMKIVDAESQPFYLTQKLVTYLPWLTWQIVLSNWAVMKIILSPKMAISPRVVRVKATQTTDLGRVSLANSITLTPGTVTILAEGSSLLVHALRDDMADDVAEGSMGRHVDQFVGEAS